MGLSFTNAHASSTICNPSRAAVWSGTRPSTTGCYDNRDHPWTRYVGEGLGLNAHFKNNGYYAAARGKTYHSSQGGNSWADFERKATVYPKEWDKYPDVKDKFPLKPHYLDGFTQDYPLMNKVKDDTDPDYYTVNFCEEQLQKAGERDKPVFLACGIVKPHLPWVVPQKYYDMYPKDEIIMPGGLADTTQRKRDLKDIPEPGIDLAKPDKEFKNVTKLDRELDAIQSYLATIAYADYNIGRLLDAFEASPEKDNTIIVLWSDHGYHLGQKQHWKKQTLWQEASSVPFIWVVPGMTKPGTTTHAPVDLQSIYPTLCDLVGLPIPEHVDGDNIRPLLENPESKWDGIALTTMRYKNHAVRDERYVYIRYWDGSEELYDTKFDPHEFDNLAKDDAYKPIKERLSRHFPVVNMKIWYDGQTCTDGDDQHIMRCPDGTVVARDPNRGCKYMKCPEPDAEDVADDFDVYYDPRPDEEGYDDGEEEEYDEAVPEVTLPRPTTPTTPTTEEENSLVASEVVGDDDEDDAGDFPVVSVIPPEKCVESSGTRFNDSFGRVKVCAWLTEPTERDRIGRQCSEGLGLKTDADKAYPISCRKCKPSSSTIQKEEAQLEGNCQDKEGKFVTQRGNNRDCGWFTRESDKIAERMEECKFRGGSHCPKTCGLCSG